MVYTFTPAALFQVNSKSAIVLWCPQLKPILCYILHKTKITLLVCSII